MSRRRAGLRAWALFAAGFPAKTSVSRARARASTEREAAFGGSSHASLAKSARASSSSKTSQRLQAGGSLAFCETLPVSGMWGLGTWSARPRLEPRISDDEFSSLLPTPTAVPYGTGQNGTYDGVTPYNGRGKKSLDSLARAGLLPTPMARDARGRTNEKRNSPTLADLSTAGDPPTPTASDAKGSRNKTATRGPSAKKVSIGPTLTDALWLGWLDGVRYEAGALHPQYVEWMMGFPLWWTDLDGDDADLPLTNIVSERSETPSSHRRRKWWGTW